MSICIGHRDLTCLNARLMGTGRLWAIPGDVTELVTVVTLARMTGLTRCIYVHGYVVQIDRSRSRLTREELRVGSLSCRTRGGGCHGLTFVCCLFLTDVFEGSVCFQGPIYPLVIVSRWWISGGKSGENVIWKFFSKADLFILVAKSVDTSDQGLESRDVMTDISNGVYFGLKVTKSI